MIDSTNPATAADEPTPEEIAAASTIRPLDQLPSNWTIKGNPRLPEPSLSTLSLEDQATVRQRAGSNDPEALNSALIDFLREKTGAARILYGAGDGATEAERTALAQMANLRRLGEEAARIEGELEAVDDYRTEYVNGKPVAVPVYRFTHDGRSAREARLNEIRYEMALISGIQGEEELKRAAREDAIRARQLREQLADHAEAKALAAKREREKRVEKLAEAYAKHGRSNLG